MSLIVAYAYVYHLESRIIGSLSRACSRVEGFKRSRSRLTWLLPTRFESSEARLKVFTLFPSSPLPLRYCSPSGRHFLPRQGVTLAVIPMSEDSKIIDLFIRFCIKEDSYLQVVNLTDALPVIIIVRKICVRLSRRNARQARLKLETILAARSTLRKPLIHAWFTEINLVTASDLPALLKKTSYMVVEIYANNIRVVAGSPVW